ncbi:MAG TPA: TIGR03067 domain-containing protein [Pirellulaceae bacterium]|nr:TIGR03067 domain-containing protein [Pirellulaceae bacterium]
MQRTLLMALLAISLTALAQAEEQGAASDVKPKAPAETYSQEGVWKPIAAVLGGVRLPDEAVQAITLKITGDNYEVTIAGAGEQETDKGTCTLDTTTVPKRMTIKGTDGPNRGKTFLAIYEMKDAVSMRVCYDLSGKEFPTEFKAPKGTQRYLAGYRRQPPAETTTPK